MRRVARCTRFAICRIRPVTYRFEARGDVQCSFLEGVPISVCPRSFLPRAAVFLGRRPQQIAVGQITQYSVRFHPSSPFTQARRSPAKDDRRGVFGGGSQREHRLDRLKPYPTRHAPPSNNPLASAVQHAKYTPSIKQRLRLHSRRDGGRFNLSGRAHAHAPAPAIDIAAIRARRDDVNNYNSGAAEL